MPEGIINYSKNIEAKGGTTKDPLWVNFVKKGNNMNLIIDMIKSSALGGKRRQSENIEVYREVAENYK